MRNNIKKQLVRNITIMVLLMAVISISVITSQKEKTINTNTEVVSTKKIEWGIKRNDNHEQPDVGSENRKILEENNGICLGKKESKTIYLTFDEGYEAGYTSEILKILKENDVKATFFLTAHYVNTQEDLVKQMIDEGHIIGNHTPKYLMPSNNIEVKC